MYLVRLALRNPYFVIVLVLLISVFGLIAINRIPTDILPQFKTPAVQIVTFYPGMPAETVERDISTRMQRWTGQSVGIEHQEAKSMLGVSIVKDFFREDIDPNTAMAQVTSYAMSDLYYLPPGTVPPMVMPFDPTASVPLCLLTVKSDLYNETELYDIAYFQLRNRLQAIQGVIAPAVYGGKLRRILTYIDSNKLQSRSLSLMDVVNTLHKFNVFIPTGSARMGNIEYQIESNSMVPAVSQLNDFPIKLDGKAPVLLKDIGWAEDSAELQSNIVRVDGKRQLYVPIYRQPGANSIKVVNGVRSAIPELNTRLPSGVQLDVAFDQSSFIRDSIKNLVSEGVVGAVLAALMILLFLQSFKSSMFVLILLPLSVISSIIFLYFTGNSVNAMTLGGLTLAVGLLLDEGIVSLENIERHIKMGKPSNQAVIDAMQEVATPRLLILLSIISVFVPLIFLAGLAKFLFTPLAIAVSFAMVASYILSMTVVPSLCSKFLVLHTNEKKSMLSVFFDSLQSVYAKTLDAAIKRRLQLLLLVSVLFVSAVLAFKHVGSELFPHVDSGQFTIRARVASGTKPERTEEILSKIEASIREAVGNNNLNKIITNIGVLNDWPAAYTPNSGPHDAFILVQLSDDKEDNDLHYIGLLRGILTDQFPGVEFSFEHNSMLRAALNFGLPSPINLQIRGNDLQIDYEIAQEIKKRISKIHGLTDIRIQQRLDYPQYKIQIDRRKCAEIGLTPDDVVKNVVTAFNSSVSFAKSFWIDEKNGNHYWIGAQYPETAFEDLQTLLNVPVTGQDQKQPILLRNLVSIERATAPSEVMHYNINRVIDVYANVEGTDLGTASDKIEEELEKIEKEGKVPPGYAVLRRGEVKSMEESFKGLGFGLLLAS
ncbi:MAG: efflux RND transporter permease subunit, partial [Planctomycetes bacterium]|nr:efflux RND transporter permease subunit [Planctomycetota bacterium]